MTHLKVAVRVRPFSASEVSVDSRSTLYWHSDSSLTLTKLGDTEKLSRFHHEALSNDADARSARLFTFDNCFWSDPACDLNNRSTQQTVFETIGEQMLEALFEGINTTVLGYGQSGTGKTYTMMGTETDPGLAPRLCLEVFERINASDATKYTSKSFYKVEISFMEIYNEKVRDLLDEQSANVHKKTPVALRIREHPKFGPYVEGLKRHVVTSSQEALKLLHSGMQRRMSAPTQANTHSSRSHAIFTIYFTAVQMAGTDMPREIAAKLNVVDLAGSERTHRDNGNRIRLKEGALINRSLATLGNVINALAENTSYSSSSLSLVPHMSDLSLASSVSIESFPSASSSNCSPRRRPTFIPYRNSVLTWILKDSLGGNARTFLVAAVSPYSGAYKETLSTLRFAQRAKLVVNRPVANEEASVTLIRHLKNEVLRLKTLLNQMVDSKESMNESIIYTENIIEDSIKVRTPPEIIEPEIQVLYEKRTQEENAAKETKDASVQTLLTLITGYSSENSESSNDESCGSTSVSEKKLCELDDTVYRKEVRRSKISFSEGNEPNCLPYTSSTPLRNRYDEESGYPIKSPSPPRSLRKLYRPKPLDRKQLNRSDKLHSDLRNNIAYENRDSFSPAVQTVKDYYVGRPKMASHCQLNFEKEITDSTLSHDSERTQNNRTSFNDKTLRIVKDAMLLTSEIKTRIDKKVRFCPYCCGIKENPVCYFSASCADSPRKEENDRLHDFRSTIRQELLAIRRRLVARTASPQVAKLLPYLSDETSEKNFGNDI